MQNKFRITIILSIIVALAAVAWTQYQHQSNEIKQIPDFIPTNEWKEVLPGQAIPRGLKVKMDFNTHKKFAKLDDGVEDTQNQGIVVSDNSPSITEKKEVSEEDKLAKVIADALLNKEDKPSHESPDEMKERVLLTLPEPLPELKHYNTLSEEEKKKLINSIWERRQRDIEEAMKSVRGDADILIERINDLRRDLPLLSEQPSNLTLLDNIKHSIIDIQWLILDVDNTEDFITMKGESLLLSTLSSLLSIPDMNIDATAETVVTIATLYKNTISITNLTDCESFLHMILPLASSEDAVLRKKVFYSINILISKYPAMADFFIQQQGIAVLEKQMISSNKEFKLKALLIYKNLLSQFPSLPALSTMNICSKALEDLSSIPEGNYQLMESYVQLLKVAKEHNELSCINQLKNSNHLMTSLKETYSHLVELARKEVIEEEEEGYYTSLVHLLHGVFDKDIE